jgi:hypothetical protein
MPRRTTKVNSQGKAPPDKGNKRTAGQGEHCGEEEQDD